MSMRKRIDLAANAGAGNGTAFECEGGKFSFFGEATWGGGSAKLQFQSPNGTWLDVPNSTLSANGILNVDIPQGQVRSVIATSTAAYLYLVPVPLNKN